MEDDNSLDVIENSSDGIELLKAIAGEHVVKSSPLLDWLSAGQTDDETTAAALENRQRRLELESCSSVIAKAKNAKRSALRPQDQPRILKSALATLAPDIAKLTGEPGQRGRKRDSAVLLEHLDPWVIAKITLQVMLDHADGETSELTISRNIGWALRAELRLANSKTMSEAEKAELAGRIREAKRKKRSPRERRQELIRRLQDEESSARMSMDLYELALQKTGLFQPKRKYNKPTTLELSIEKQGELFQAHADELQYLRPHNLPMVCRPTNWSALSAGGYLTFELWAMKLTPYNKWAKEHVKRLKSPAGRPQVLFDVLNHLQGTAWEIDKSMQTGMAKVLLSFIDAERTQKHRQRLAKKRASELQDAAAIDEAVDVSVAEPENEIDHDSFAGNTGRFRFRQWVPALISNVALSQAYIKRGQPFYFVWQADFRGRCYPVCKSLGPQGHDSAHGLLRFAEGKPLGGERGEFWFALHGANMLDPKEVKRASFEDRVQWVHNHSDDIIAAANDPLGAIEFLGGDKDNLKKFSDSVWRALAFCEEWKRWRQEGSAFKSHLPITVDGTCNAIQHLAALTRCEDLGRKVNLRASEGKGDIYALVARRLQDAVKEHQVNGLPPCPPPKDPKKPTEQQNWEHFQLLLKKLKIDAPTLFDRSFCKKPVMTRPYGMSDFGLRGAINEWFEDSDFASAYFGFNPKLRNSAVTYMVKILKQAFAAELPRAEAFMNWMRTVTGKVSELQRPIDWTTYLTLPIRHARVVQEETKEIITNLDKVLKKKTKPRAREFKRDTDVINKEGAQNAVIAHFVHAQDATHMMMTTLAAKAAGINSLRMVHDSFATHACDMDAFSAIIRQTFVELYTQEDAVERFYVNAKRELMAYGGEPSDIPDIPERGTLDVREVLESRYFFS